MVKIQFITILLVVTYFLGGVVSVTDKQFEVSDVYFSIQVLKLIHILYFIKYFFAQLPGSFEPYGPKDNAIGRRKQGACSIG